jgi:hypothetical protein
MKLQPKFILLVSLKDGVGLAQAITPLIEVTNLCKDAAFAILKVGRCFYLFEPQCEHHTRMIFTEEEANQAKQILSNCFHIYTHRAEENVFGFGCMANAPSFNFYYRLFNEENE